MKFLEQFYLENHILAKSITRKLYRHLKAAAIGILQEEMKRAPNSKKQTWRMAIRTVKDKL